MGTIPDDAICATCDKLLRGTVGLDKVLAEMGYVYYDEARKRTIVKKRVEYCRCVVAPVQEELWWMKE